MQFRFCCLWAAIFFLPKTWADSSPGTQLDPVVVTVTRTEQALSNTLASVTVIDRAEIERRQSLSVQDLLRGVPGVAISNQGGIGKNSTLFLRGTNANHLLVLVDGLRVGSATLGLAAFQDLPVDQIDHIEIVRGPRSGLYGSEAIGGVIQIFTRKGGKGFQPSLSAGAGSHSLYKVTGGLSGGDPRAWYSFNGSQQETDGFNACAGSPTDFSGGGCYTFQPDRDGYRNTSGSARGGYRFDNGVEIEGNLLHAEGENQYDGTAFVGNHGPVLQQVLGGRLKFSPASHWDSTLRAGRSLDESQQWYQRQFVSRFDTQRVSVTWQNDLRIAPGQLLSLGLDFYNDQIRSSTVYASQSRDDKAAFLQYQLNLHGFDAALAARYDDNEQFGSQPTGNVALGYGFDNGMRISASWGNAFKAPTFNDLYYPGYGNPRLKPESSESWELGISGKQVGVNWSVNGYYTRMDELIGGIYRPSLCPPPYFFCAENLNQASVLGLETQASTRLMGWELTANLSLLEPKNLSPDSTHGNSLPRRAKSMFRFDVDRDFGPAGLGLTVNGNGRMYEDAANKAPIAGFVTLDLRGKYRISRSVQLEGRLANLLDKSYETSRLYYQDGRNFFVNLRFSPDGL